MYLAIQLVTSAILVLLMTLIHGGGVVAIARLLRLDAPPPIAERRPVRTAMILSEVALLLFLLHMVEVMVFAAFYLMVGAVGAVEEALFLSASAYSTLSQPAGDFPVEWRLVGALEGLIGFLLIGWSTAFFVTDMNRLLRPNCP